MRPNPEIENKRCREGVPLAEEIDAIKGAYCIFCIATIVEFLVCGAQTD
jgi:hypothetical protein